LENNEVVELAKKIRKEADRYGDSFSAFSDDMQAQILALGYNRAQCLPSMANVLCVEALKINNEFLNVCPFREFTQLETAKALVKCFSGYFASGSQTKKIAELVLDMRKYQFKE
jgi:acetyl/propionyl-CoA carboxylase alpha subunit